MGRTCSNMKNTMAVNLKTLDFSRHSEFLVATGVEDDVAALALEHRHRELDHRKGRFEMAVHHAIPFLLGELVDRIAASQTRVVDQDVQAAKGLNRGVDGAPRAFHRDNTVVSRD